MSIIQFEISMPTDEGFIGRECNNPECLKYFRVHAQSIQTQMYCPYCASLFSNDQLHTQDQIEFMKLAGQEKALEHVYNEIDKMFAGFARSFSGNKYITFNNKPIRYRAKDVAPTYKEQKVDTELVCPECAFRFQVFGIFGYCPGCRNENILIYDANLIIIKREISNSDNAERALRHAYSDLVSTFESYCKKKAADIQADKPTFQDLFNARRFFKEYKNVDIFFDLNNEQLLCLRRVFQKRHACQHSGGQITEQYIKKIPEDKALIGTKAVLTLQEFEEGAKALRQALGKLLE